MVGDVGGDASDDDDGEAADDALDDARSVGAVHRTSQSPTSTEHDWSMVLHKQSNSFVEPSRAICGGSGNNTDG